MGIQVAITSVKVTISKSELTKAAFEGGVEIVNEALRKAGIPISNTACLSSLERGRLEIWYADGDRHYAWVDEPGEVVVTVYGPGYRP